MGAVVSAASHKSAQRYQWSHTQRLSGLLKILNPDRIVFQPTSKKVPAGKSYCICARRKNGTCTRLSQKMCKSLSTRAPSNLPTFAPPSFEPIRHQLRRCSLRNLIMSTTFPSVGCIALHCQYTNARLVSTRQPWKHPRLLKSELYCTQKSLRNSLWTILSVFAGSAIGTTMNEAR